MFRTLSWRRVALSAEVVNRYRQEFPHVTLTLHKMATLRQLDAIGQRTLDLGFVRPPEIAVPAGIKLTTCAKIR